jgi:hypothetical protein
VVSPPRVPVPITPIQETIIGLIARRNIVGIVANLMLLEVIQAVLKLERDFTFLQRLERRWVEPKIHLLPLLPHLQQMLLRLVNLKLEPSLMALLRSTVPSARNLSGEVVTMLTLQVNIEVIDLPKLLPGRPIIQISNICIRFLPPTLLSICPRLHPLQKLQLLLILHLSSHLLQWCQPHQQHLTTI